MKSYTISNKLFFVLSICSLLLSNSCTNQIRLNTTKVGNGWAKNSVNTVIFRQNAITTYKNTQFTAFYDEDSQLVLAKRKLGSDTWEKHLTQYAGNTKDAHNAISIATDGEGYLHVSWDHHDDPLRYAVSNKPLGLELSDEKEMTGGMEEEKVSYPQFYNLDQENLLFLCRSGRSGQGRLVAKSYDLKTKKWMTLHQNLIDGEDKRNAYWQAYVDKSGTIHLSWVWRQTWDVSTNHDLAYARSTDGGQSWERSTGEKYELPITKETAEYAWKIQQNSSLINQTSMTADKEGNPYIATYWNEERERATQFKVVYLKDGVWQQESTDFRTTVFDLDGGGTKSIPVSRPEIFLDSSKEDTSPTVYLLYRDQERNNKVSLAYKQFGKGETWQIKDLTEFSVGQWEPNFDKELFKTNKTLHIFVQKVSQIDAEGIADEASTPVQIIEVNTLPQ